MYKSVYRYRLFEKRRKRKRKELKTKKQKNE